MKTFLILFCLFNLAFCLPQVQEKTAENAPEATKKAPEATKSTEVAKPDPNYFEAFRLMAKNGQQALTKFTKDVGRGFTNYIIPYGGAMGLIGLIFYGIYTVSTMAFDTKSRVYKLAYDGFQQVFAPIGNVNPEVEALSRMFGDNQNLIDNVMNAIGKYSEMNGNTHQE